MGKIRRLIFMLLILAVGMAGCSDGKQTATKATPEENTSFTLPAFGNQAQAASPLSPEGREPYVIGFTILGEEATFFKTVRDTVFNAADKYGIKLLYAVNDRVPERMRETIDGFVAQGVDMIVDFTVLTDPGNAISAELKEKGIPMLSIDCFYKDAYFFGINNLEAGKSLGRFLATEITRRWKGNTDAMLMLYAQNNGEIVKQRVTGAYDGLIESGIDISSELLTYTNINTPSNKMTDIAHVANLVTDYLKAHPDKKHIGMVAGSDDVAIGALTAVKAAGRNDECFIVSHNCDPSAVENFKKADNCWIGSVNYAPDTYGEQIIRICVDILSGVEYDQEIYNDTYVVSIYNVNDYFPS